MKPSQCIENELYFDLLPPNSFAFFLMGLVPAFVPDAAAVLVTLVSAVSSADVVAAAVVVIEAVVAAVVDV